MISITGKFCVYHKNVKRISDFIGRAKERKTKIVHIKIKQKKTKNESRIFMKPIRIVRD